MIEVQARLRFNSHCLGDCRQRKTNRMLRDPDDRVMFKPVWWQSLMRYAARVVSRHHETVKRIDWDPIVDGETRLYRRYYKPNRFTLHEAFFPGDVIGVNAVIPDDLTLDDFSQLLDVAGRYRGISPYGVDKGFGNFEVQHVKRRQRVVASEHAARMRDGVVK